MLGTLLSAAAASNPAAAVDPSQWKCASCPVETGTSGSLDAGVGVVSDASARYGDYTGLDRKGGVLLLGGSVRYLDASGLWGKLEASDLGTDARSLSAVGGREGVFSANLAYDELPRHFDGGAMTPFLGVGGSVLTLPAGFTPAGTTDAMSLASTLQSVDIGYKRSRLDLGATWLQGHPWSFSVGARHMTREGTEPTSGSFFSNASQLVAPVDQTTDNFEGAAAYAGRDLQARLAYTASVFRNDDASLTWTDPFTSGTLGAGLGQLALAPDNQFHQLQASIGYRLGPLTRVSGDLAVGRMTQDAAFVAPTLNAALVVPVLPRSSLQGAVDTLNANLALSASPLEGLRLSAAWSHDERDNKTPTAAFPSVSTDLFLGPDYTNRPYGYKQDRLKLGAGYFSHAGLKLDIGFDYRETRRTLQAVDTTRDATTFARLSAQATPMLAVSLKLAEAQRSNSAYSDVSWAEAAENPLLRRFDMARRIRDSADARADLTLSDSVSLGMDLGIADDNYPDTTIGLTDGHTVGVGADVSVAFSERTRLTLFVHADRVRSHQAGSQGVGLPDWWAGTKDAADMGGIGVRHAAIKDKLDLGADLAFARSRSDVAVDNRVPAPGFPTATTAMDSAKFFASWHLSKAMSLTGSYWFEHYDAADWQLDGVQPATIPNLLAFGVQPPHYNVSMVRVSLRYRF